MSESEAQRMLCPVKAPGSGNPYCDGCECMAWVWRSNDAAETIGDCKYLNRREGDN